MIQRVETEDIVELHHRCYGKGQHEVSSTVSRPLTVSQNLNLILNTYEIHTRLLKRCVRMSCTHKLVDTHLGSQRFLYLGQSGLVKLGVNGLCFYLSCIVFYHASYLVLHVS